MYISDPLPDEMVLKTSKARWIFTLLICLLFIAIGVFLISVGEPAGWLAVIFCGPIAVVSLLLLFSYSSYLRLHSEGFEQRVIGRRVAYQWKDVSEFDVLQWGSLLVWCGEFFAEMERCVSFNNNGDDGKASVSLNMALKGRSSHLSDNFGMKAQALADLMNAYRRRALSER